MPMRSIASSLLVALCLVACVSDYQESASSLHPDDPLPDFHLHRIPIEVPATDLLLVIDNREEMCANVASLKEEMRRITEDLVDSGNNFRLAVISSNMEDPLQSGIFQRHPGAAIQEGPCPEAFSPQELEQCPAELPPYLTADHYRGRDGKIEKQKLQDRALCYLASLRFGSSAPPMGLRAAQNALHDDLQRGPNQSFLRNHASLALNFVSNTEDCSLSDATSLFDRQQNAESHPCRAYSEHLDSVSGYTSWLEDLKKGNRRKIHVMGALAPDLGQSYTLDDPPQPSCRERNIFPGRRYQEVVEYFSTPSWSTAHNLCEDRVHLLQGYTHTPPHTLDLSEVCLDESLQYCEEDTDCPLLGSRCVFDKNYCSGSVLAYLERPYVNGPVAPHNCRKVGGNVRCALTEGVDFQVRTSQSCPRGLSLRFSFQPGYNDTSILIRHPLE